MTRYTIREQRTGWPILRGLVVAFIVLGALSYVSMPLATWLGALVLLLAFVMAGIRWVAKSASRK